MISMNCGSHEQSYSISKLRIEIEIKRGHDLVNEFPKKNDFFLNQWINGITPSVETEFVLIK